MTALPHLRYNFLKNESIYYVGRTICAFKIALHNKY